MLIPKDPADIVVGRFDDPPVECTNLNDSVHDCLHTAGSRSFKRWQRIVEPDINGIRQKFSEIRIVVFQE